MTNTFKKITEEELTAVNGGQNGSVSINVGPWRAVMNPQTGWVALRSAPNSAQGTEIGRLYNDDIVQITGSGSEMGSDGHTYMWVYSPKLHMSGYVNRMYIE